MNGKLGRILKRRDNTNTLEDLNVDVSMVQKIKSQEPETESKTNDETYEWNTNRFQKIEARLKYVLQKIDQLEKAS